MDTLEQIRDRIIARFPTAAVALVTNPGPAAQSSLMLEHATAVEIARFLRDDPALQLDQCSNVTGVDWPAREVIDPVKSLVPDPAGGPDQVVVSTTKRIVPGALEVVYHLYSIARRHGPVVLRLRTADRDAGAVVPSLTPVWRACEFQEREVFDLFGVHFTGHPDLRRILMWDGFNDHPMRRDYVAPDDYEWEPTPHGEVLAQAKLHYPAPAVATPATTEAPQP